MKSNTQNGIVLFLVFIISLLEFMSREYIGIETVYHCTNKQAGGRIWRESQMKPGNKGMFGAAIYFADTKEAARYKAQYDGSGDDVVLKATVDFGMTLVLEHPDHTMTASRLQSQGCDSIKGRSSPGADWEYAVFDPTRIRLLSFEGELDSTATSWVADLHVVLSGDRDSGISRTPSGYRCLGQDLCQGTKKRGDYVFLSYKTTRNIDEAVTDIALDYFDDAQTSSEYVGRQGRTYKRILADLNSGARGQYVYLSFTKDKVPGVPPVSDICTDCSRNSEVSRLDTNWEYVCWDGTTVPGDTNKGAGGPYIRLSMLKT